MLYVQNVSVRDGRRSTCFDKAIEDNCDLRHVSALCAPGCGRQAPLCPKWTTWPRNARSSRWALETGTGYGADGASRPLPSSHSPLRWNLALVSSEAARQSSVSPTYRRRSELDASLRHRFGGVRVGKCSLCREPCKATSETSVLGTCAVTSRCKLASMNAEHGSPSVLFFAFVRRS